MGNWSYFTPLSGIIFTYNSWRGPTLWVNIVKSIRLENPKGKENQSPELWKK